MERVRRLAGFWSWLPAFRAVAETEHLPSAAELLQVGPSALSRSIRLLERAMGVALFDRVGRRIVLTADGRTLLSAVRHAMRLVDDGVATITSADLRGPVRIASTGTVATVYLLPALRALRVRYPDLEPSVQIGVPERAAELLLRGEIDVAFQAAPTTDPELASRPLGQLQFGVYCGPGHPLYGVTDVVDADRLRDLAFVAPPDDDRGVPVDGWPAAWPRSVALRLDQVREGCDACADGGYLAVLPDALVGRRVAGLHRLGVEIAPPVALFAAHRTALGGGPRADVAVVDEVARQISIEQR